MTYPEHEKMHARRAEHEAIQSFLNWVQDSEDYALCSAYDADTGGWSEMGNYRIGRAVAEYFGVDYDAFQAEKDQMLADIRAAQGMS